MAEALGYLTLQDKALPVGLDGARIAQWSMREGTTYEAFAGKVATAWRNQCCVDGEVELAFTWIQRSPWNAPTAARSSPMTELTDNGWLTLESSQRPSIRMIDLQLLRRGGRRHHGAISVTPDQAQIEAAKSRPSSTGASGALSKSLTGASSHTDEQAIGSLGYNVPFVHSNGRRNVDFIPPAYDDVSFLRQHTTTLLASI